MLQSFISYIQKENLFESSDKILLTVSGGIDSVVMCKLFHQAGLNFDIAHCNFQLRSDESDTDEEFVEELAEKYKVKFHSISFDTSAYAKKNKLSIQVAARQLRYQWFEEIRDQFDYNYIATAHHQNDAIETFFINIIRGTGIAGLHGISPKQGKIIRPLLFTNKKQIEVFSKKNKLKHREDSSNASEKYLRNKIRLQLIPLLEELNPNINQTITEDIQHLRDTEKIYNQTISKVHSKIVKEDKNLTYISIDKLKNLIPTKPYLFEFLHPLGFNSSMVDEILNSLEGHSGKQFFSETHRLIKDREFLIIEKRSKSQDARIKTQDKRLNIKQKKDLEDETFLIKEKQSKLNFGINKITFKVEQNSTNYDLRSPNYVANIDYDKLQFPLEIRKWEKGDSFFPLGMKGKKKLSDFFIDKKLSLQEKENTWILTSDNKIVWVIGMRIDERFKVTDKTKKIYFLKRV